MVNALLYLITYLTATKSQCDPGNGCGQFATCDVEFVKDAVYGCGGIWENNGVNNGAYLCGNGYSICQTESYAASLGLTKELCTSNTLMTANNFYASLQSSSGALTCDQAGVNDLFGCCSTNSDPEFCYFGDQNNVINCGPFGAQISAHGKTYWQYGWELWCNNGNDELTCARHLKSQIDMGGGNWQRSDTLIQGGVLCCKDAPDATTPAPITAAPTPQPIALPSDFSPNQLNRISEWKSRTIYQIVTDRFSQTDNGNYTDCNDLSKYCGGTFEGIINNLDYIQGMGYDAIWISPVVENTDNGYHGYWTKNLYAINSNFGTESDLLALVQALHDRDMLLMIDVVFNHMGYTAVNNDYSSLNPFNEEKYYHDSCNNPLCTNCGISNWNYYSKDGIKEIEECRLAGLPDLDQSNEETLNILCDWLKQYVINKWMADAIRIDTVPEVNIKYWLYLLQTGSCLDNDIFNIGEYFWGDPAILGKYQPVFDSLFGYPMYYTLRDVFGDSQTMEKINWRIGEYEWNFIDYGSLGLFLDNQDNDRWLCLFKDKENKITNYKNALLFIYTFKGIPINYYGTEQSFDGCGDPGNREVLWTSEYNTDAMLYKYIETIIKYRNKYKIYDGELKVLTSNNDQDLFVFRRGNNALIVLANKGNTFNRTVSVEPGTIKIGRYCNIFNIDQDCFDYTNDAEITFYIKNGEGKLYVNMNVIVNTKYGPVEGGIIFSLDSTADFSTNTIISFIGIPYAKPPINSLRFKPPQETDEYGTDNVPFIAYGNIDYIAACPQICSGGYPFCPVIQSEDCLTLSIYTPNDSIPNQSNYPVMIWIHGGSFDFSWSTFYQYDPINLINSADNKVIVVNINYRLGILGTLYDNQYNTGVNGNFAYLDQMLAIQYVYENIANFGGNPDDITIFGESAGAHSVAFHLLYNNQYIKKGIMQSLPLGQAMRNSVTWGDIPTQFSDIIGCDVNNLSPTELLECWQTVNSDDIINAQNNPILALGEGYRWSLTVGTDLLPKDPLFEFRRIGKGRHKIDIPPFILGINKDEGYLFTPETEKNNTTYIDIVNRLTQRLSNNNYAAQKVLEYYGITETSTGPTHNYLYSYAQIITDHDYKCPAQNALKYGRFKRDDDVYHYKIENVDISLNQALVKPIYPQCVVKACHFLADVPLIFTGGRSKQLLDLFGPNTVLLSNQVQKWWTNFAATNDPNGIDAGSNKIWPVYKNTNFGRKNNPFNSLRIIGFENYVKTIINDKKNTNQICDFWDRIGYAGKYVSSSSSFSSSSNGHHRHHYHIAAKQIPSNLNSDYYQHFGINENGQNKDKKNNIYYDDEFKYYDNDNDNDNDNYIFTITPITCLMILIFVIIIICIGYGLGKYIGNKKNGEFIMVKTYSDTETEC